MRKFNFLTRNSVQKGLELGTSLGINLDSHLDLSKATMTLLDQFLRKSRMMGSSIILDSSGSVKVKTTRLMKSGVFWFRGNSKRHSKPFFGKTTIMMMLKRLRGNISREKKVVVYSIF